MTTELKPAAKHAHDTATAAAQAIGKSIETASAARDAARAVANAWRDGAAGGGDVANACGDNANAWDSIADTWHRFTQPLTGAAEQAAALVNDIEERNAAADATALDSTSDRRQPTGRIEWRGQFAFVGDEHVAALSQSWGGILMGVWDTDAGAIKWYGIPKDRAADDLLHDMHSAGALDAIPADADLFP